MVLTRNQKLHRLKIKRNRPKAQTIGYNRKQKRETFSFPVSEIPTRIPINDQRKGLVMASNEKELEKLVALARATIISRGEKPTLKRIQTETNRNMEDVCKANKRLTDREADELKATLSLAINPKIATLFLEDREQQVQERTKILKGQIENLESDGNDIEEEITNLRAEREKLETLLTEEINLCKEANDTLKLERANLEGQLQATKDQIGTLYADLSNEKKQRGDTEAKIAVAGEILGKMGAELQSERAHTEALQKELTEAETKLISTTAKVEATERLAEQLQSQNAELATELKKVRVELTEESKQRIKAETKLAMT